MDRTFYIFRHGETVGSRRGGFYGFHYFNAPILDEGVESIKKMGEYLKQFKPDLFICSKFKRCRQTAQIISDITGVPFETDKRLNERGVERRSDVRRRVRSFLEDLEKENYKNIFICTHAAVIRELVRLIDPKALPNEFQSGVTPPGVLTVIGGGKIQQLSFNSD